MDEKQQHQLEKLKLNQVATEVDLFGFRRLDQETEAQKQRKHLEKKQIALIEL